jgi:hypothetical protein
MQQQISDRKVRISGQKGMRVETLTVDTGCSDPNADWVFDQPNLGGNRLCLSMDPNGPRPADSIDLAGVVNWGVCYPSAGGCNHGSWNWSVVSFWGGAASSAYQFVTNPSLVVDPNYGGTVLEGTQCGNAWSGFWDPWTIQNNLSIDTSGCPKTNPWTGGAHELVWLTSGT